MTPFLVAFIGSIAAVWALLPFLRGAKQSINPDAPERHTGKAGTPTMGGIGIMIGAALGIGGALAWWRPEWASAALRPEFAVLAAMIVAFAIIGSVDDLIGLRRGRSLGFRARYKIALQFLVAALFVMYLAGTKTNYHSWFLDTLPAYVGVPLAVIFIVGMSNAFNLADGLDGLCAGMAAITFIAPTLAAALCAIPIMADQAGRVDLKHGIATAVSSGHVDPTLAITLALSGACVGFLIYNCNPARVFMGDTGSIPLGAAYAGAALLSGSDLVLAFCSGLFIIEAGSVILQVASFKLTGKRIFKMTPIHHHFELCGWSEPRIVTTFWVVHAIIVILVLTIAFGWGRAPFGSLR